jgi:alcohol dehydrogenase (cytochrome c)
MNKKLKWFGVSILAAGLIAAGVIYTHFDEAVPYAAMGINYFRYMNAPKGTISIESAPNVAALPAPAKTIAFLSDSDADWPSYNKTLTSERFSTLDQITPANAKNLKVLCTFDTGQYTGFNSGLLEVQGSLVFTTEYDIFSINPSNCLQNWRVHEDYTPASAQGVSRGPAYLDGVLYRGTQDGRVLAYDFKTGKRLWETTIADPKRGESAPAAPIAWNGLVFIGNAGGDVKGVKGRM